jgi:hypothetical protein
MDRRTMEKAWSRMQRRAEDAIAQAQDQANEALHYAQGAWEQAREGASDAASRASKMSARPYLNRLGDRLDTMKDEAVPYLEHLRDEARPYLRDLKKRAERWSRTAADRLSEWGGSAQGKLAEIRPMLSRGGSTHSAGLAVGPLMGLIGGGAALMYLLNGEKGAERRTMLSDKTASWLRRAEDSIDALGTQVGDRIHAAMSDARARAHEEGQDMKSAAECIGEKIKDRLGRIVDNVDDLKYDLSPSGRVSLSGPMCRRDVDRVHAVLSAIPGVTEIEDRLTLHDPAPGEVRPWSQSTRVMAGAGGAGLLLAGAKRGGLSGLLMTAVGAGLVARAALDRPMDELLNLAGDKAKAMAQQAEQGWGEMKKSAAKQFEPANHAQG